MFSYITLGTNNLPRAVRFYDELMATLGIERVRTPGESNWDGWAGWGYYENRGARELALWLCEPFDGRPASVGNGVMVAFAAPDATISMVLINVGDKTVEFTLFDKEEFARLEDLIDEAEAINAQLEAKKRKSREERRDGG